MSSRYPHNILNDDVSDDTGASTPSSSSVSLSSPALSLSTPVAQSAPTPPPPPTIIVKLWLPPECRFSLRPVMWVNFASTADRPITVCVYGSPFEDILAHTIIQSTNGDPRPTPGRRVSCAKRTPPKLCLQDEEHFITVGPRTADYWEYYMVDFCEINARPLNQNFMTLEEQGGDYQSLQLHGAFSTTGMGQKCLGKQYEIDLNNDKELKVKWWRWGDKHEHLQPVSHSQAESLDFDDSEQLKIVSHGRALFTVEA